MKEINIRSEKTVNIETIYLGGGTPSLLSQQDLTSIFTSLEQNFSINTNAEITLEANPDDINTSQLTMWKQAGINRLSIGVQSFFEEDLLWMNRAHNALQAKTSIASALNAGFGNMSIDLIYGTPTLSDENWDINLSTVIDFGVPHISCYALTVEPKTALHSLIEKKKMQDTEPEQQSRQFLQMLNKLQAADYEHYEISNFSLQGKRSQHNTSYWQNKPYYGFGPSAHSFNGSNIRSWNIANNTLYISSLNKNVLPVEQETLSAKQQLNEYIMTSLRTVEGVSLYYVSTRFGDDSVGGIMERIQNYMQDKILVTDNTIRLTPQGKLFADGIASDLFEG